MKKNRHITEEDLLVTEALLAKSYAQLKRSVLSAPSRAFRSTGQTARRHPFATAGAAIVAAAALYGIVRMMTSHASSCGEKEGSGFGLNRKPGRMDIIQQAVSMLVPLAAPYIIGYVQRYLGKKR